MERFNCKPQQSIQRLLNTTGTSQSKKAIIKKKRKGA